MPTLQGFNPLWLRDRDNKDQLWGVKLPDGREFAMDSLVSGAGNMNAAAAFIQPSVNSSAQTVGAGASWSDDLQFSFQNLPEYLWIAPVWVNYDLTNPLTISAKVAAAGADKAAANGLTWAGVTFGGASSYTLPVATAGVARNIPSFVVGDPIQVSSVARSDSGASRLARVITTVASSGGSRTIQFHAQTSGGMTALMADSEANGFQVAGQFVNGGDWVTTTPSSSPVSNANTPSLCVGVLVGVGSRALVGAVFGDSRAAGAGSTSGAISWPHRVNFKGASVTLLNLGDGGEQLVDSIAKMKAFVTAFRPAFVVLNAPSPNDAVVNTAAGTLASWGRLMAAAEWCRQRGVLCYVLTPLPAGSYYAQALGIFTRMQAIPSNTQLRFVDVTTPSQSAPGSYIIRADWDSGDGTHYNDAGYRGIRDIVLADMLKL